MVTLRYHRTFCMAWNALCTEVGRRAYLCCIVRRRTYRSITKTLDSDLSIRAGRTTVESRRKAECSCRRVGIRGSELRVVVRGSDNGVKNVMRGVRVGTVRSAEGYGVSLRSGSSDRWRVTEDTLEAVVVWAHQGDKDAHADPLEDAWTSHRDMMGLRHPVGWGALLPRTTHQRKDSPSAWRWGLAHYHTRRSSCPSTTQWLAARGSSVLAVLPGDRRGFRLFVHWPEHQAGPQGPLRPLCLTRRRVRQLAASTGLVWWVLIT